MRKVAWVLMVTGVCVGRLSASMPLDAAVEAVLNRNGQVRASRQAQTAAREALSAARAQRYPRLTVESSITRGDNPVYVFGSLLQQQAFTAANFALDSLNNPGDFTNIRHSLDLGLPLFTAYETSLQVRSGRLAVEEASARRAMVDQAARLAAVEAYLAVLFYGELSERLAERIAASEHEVESARRLNARGLVLGSDFFAAQAILTGLKARKAQLDEELRAARSSLSVLVGAAEIETDGRLTAPAYPVAPAAELTNLALSNRPELILSRLRRAMAGADLKRSARSFLPRVDAFASIETNTEDFDSNPSHHMVGVRSRFPIGDPTYFHRRSAARARHESEHGQEDAVADAVRLDVLQAHAALGGIAASLPGIEEARRQTAKALELFRPLYREGRQSIFDVLKAEAALFDAERSVAESRRRLHLGFARLAWSTGTLDAQVVREIAGRLKEQP